jgi:HEPN domain-containing protein
MSLSGSKGRLNGITRELTLKWEDTKVSWRDLKAQEFEQHYLREMLIEMGKTMAALEKLDELLRKIRNDCE